MDPQLLALLPDAAKLGILRHLGQEPAPVDVARQQLPERHQAAPPAAAAQQPQGNTASQVPPILAGRRLSGGLALIDGFLGSAEVVAAQAEARQVLQAGARPAGMVTASEGAPWTRASDRGDKAAWLSLGSLAAAEHRHLGAAAQRLLSLRPWLRQQGFDVGGRASIQLACYPGAGARYVRHRDACSSVPYRSVTAILYLNPGWSAEAGGQLCVYNHSTCGGDPCAATAADLRLRSAAAGGAGQPPPASSSSSHGEDGAEGGAGEAAGAAAPQQQQQQQPPPQQQQQVCSGLEEGHPATVVPPLGGRLVVMDSRLLHEVLPAQAERYAVTVWFSRAPPAAAAAGAGGAAAAGTGAARAAAAGAGACSAAAGMAALALQGQDAPAPAAPAAAQQPPLDGAAVASPGCIFVSVPAYRDSEAQWTLADLFDKAAHPERVRVGICWQLELPEEGHLMRVAGDQRWLGQVRQVVLPACEARGPCKARALAQQLWEGEEFHLQIDSHMRFVEQWDAALLRMLRQAEAAAGHPRVVLSTYPPGYEGEGPEAVVPAAPLPTVLCAGGWGQHDGLLRTRGRKLREPLAAPAPALFWAAGLSFSRAQLLLEAPYPRDLPGLFFGEELLQLVRMWRRGWDVFTPPQAAAFHLWSRKHRPTFQQDHAGDAQQRQRSQRRVTAALAGEEGEAAGSGAARRSLEQFFRQTGVDFRGKTISDRARNGGLPPGAFLAPVPLDGSP